LYCVSQKKKATSDSIIEFLYGQKMLNENTFVAGFLMVIF
jgi:hypothetical protein